MTGSIEQGIGEIHGDSRLLHVLVRLPRPVEAVWPAFSTPDGLAAWFTPADVLQPRLGGAITLRGVGSGRVTAWDVERVAEYTVEGGHRIRFHLERDGDDRSALRFTHEFRGEAEPEAAWRARFAVLMERLGPGRS